MADNIKQITEEALKLPLEMRAALAGTLLDSLEETIDENVEAEWVKEVEKRLADLDSRKLQAIPWTEARRKILGD